MASLSERNDKERLRKEKKRHRIGLVITVILCLTAIVSVGTYGWYLYNNQKYTSYEVTHSTDRKDGNSVQYLSYNSGQILKYSRDGAMAMDGEGTILWNGSYEFANPMASVCNEFVAIADVGGTEAYVYNGNDSGTRIEVLHPIEQVAVAGQGVVALLLEDAMSDVIQIYNPYASGDGLLVEVPTNVQTDGFPVNLAISEDGTKLVTAMVSVTGGSQENYVNFYNFSEVGQNNINRLVGARSFGQTTVSRIGFLGNNTVCVYTENGFNLYSMKQVPNDICGETFKKDIKSVFSNRSYVGFVLEDYTEEGSYRVLLYDLSGSKVFDQMIDFDYEEVFVSGEEIALYNSLEFQVYRINGKEKYKGNFDTGISYIMPVNNFERYTIIDENTINQIKLK